MTEGEGHTNATSHEHKQKWIEPCLGRTRTTLIPGSRLDGKENVTCLLGAVWWFESLQVHLLSETSEPHKPRLTAYQMLECQSISPSVDD